MLDRVTLRKEPGLREKACGGLRFYGSGVPHVSGLRVRVLTFLHSNPASDLVEDNQIHSGASWVSRATSHAIYPKMSLTLSKMEEPRSAGLFSTFSVAPSCSTNLRCSRVSFVGVSTRT